MRQLTHKTDVAYQASDFTGSGEFTWAEAEGRMYKYMDMDIGLAD